MGFFDFLKSKKTTTTPNTDDPTSTPDTIVEETPSEAEEPQTNIDEETAVDDMEEIEDGENNEE